MTMSSRLSETWLGWQLDTPDRRGWNLDQDLPTKAGPGSGDVLATGSERKWGQVGGRLKEAGMRQGAEAPEGR